MGPPKGPLFARSTSTWIHWWSPVASANRLTCSWVIRCQSLYPRWAPILSRRPSMPEIVVVMGRNATGSLEPDALVLPALGVQQQGQQGDLEHEAHDVDRERIAEE